jgi:hypothetical protein
MRKHKSVEGLKQAWKHLDDACGSIDNGLFELLSMNGLPDDMREYAETIGLHELVVLKNSIEELIVKEGGSIDD